MPRLLLTGATGFVGRHVRPALVHAGWDVVGATRDPQQAAQRFPREQWVQLDVADPDSVSAALEGCDAALYLVHGMGDGRDYAAAERRAAANFLAAAEKNRVRRIVYLGGIRPRGAVSTHLGSRLATGEVLRSGRVSTIELGASMIIGPGSESWRIVRDLAARLPLMVIPKWLESRSQPIAIEDVCAAMVHALRLDMYGSAVFSLPGPETLSAREILRRTAELGGIRPLMFGVPFVSPRLSSYWIRLVTRANRHVASELVQGLTGDLVAEDDGFWDLLPAYQRTSFDVAASRALTAEAQTLPASTRRAEALIRALAVSSPRPALSP